MSDDSSLQNAFCPPQHHRTLGAPRLSMEPQKKGSSELMPAMQITTTDQTPPQAVPEDWSTLSNEHATSQSLQRPVHYSMWHPSKNV